MNHLEPRVAGCERLINALRAAIDSILRRLAAVEQAVRDFPGGGGGGGGSPDGGTGNSVIVKLTTAVSTMAGASPGSGTGTIQAMSGVTLTDTGRSVTVYSIHDKVVSAGAYGQATKAAGNQYFLHDVDSCNNIQAAGNAAAMDWLGGEFGTGAGSAAGAAGGGGVGRAGDAGGSEEFSEPVWTPVASASRAQHLIASGSGTAPSAAYSATTAGSLLVACLTSEAGGAITFPAGWTKAVGPTDRAAIWYYPNNPGGVTTVTATQASASWVLALIEYTGVAASPTVHTNTAGPTVGSSLNSGSVSPAGPGVVIACFSDDNSDAFSSPTGGFAIRDQAAGGSFNQGAALDRIVTAGTYSAGVSFPGGDTAWAVIASFN